MSDASKRDANAKSYRSLNEYLYEHEITGARILKTDLARHLSELSGTNVDPSILTRLLNPRRYRFRPSEPVTAAIAKVINRTPEYVARYYEREVAA